MITIKGRVKSALAGTCECIVYGYPFDMTSDTRVCWRESENRAYAQADGHEHICELCYTIDVFAPTAEGADSIAQMCDTSLVGMGLRRVSAHVQTEMYTTHITARYRVLADASGNLFQ